jgi:hypothetical protein
MNLKKSVFAILAIFIAVNSFAQLSERTNDPGNFKFGTRPLAGDWGLNLQMYTTGAANFDAYFQNVPIVNLQYYLTNELALRFGIQATKHKTVFAGEGYDTTVTVNTDLGKFSYKTSTREYMVYAGVEKHFALTNLLDVYVGGQIPLGFSGNTQLNDYTFNSLANNELVRTNYFIYGMEAFLGLQVFLADLPIAVGVEWGIAGYGKLFNSTYHSEQANGGPVQNFYTVPGNNTSPAYSSLDSRTFDMESMVRFRISYYFNK